MKTIDLEIYYIILNQIKEHDKILIFSKVSSLKFHVYLRSVFRGEYAFIRESWAFICECLA